jgi:NADH-quinone oxidoreductase subunit H
VYFTCATASVNRAPFDLAEAESELVAGFHTEYSGLRWSFFFMAEYGSMLAVSLLASILFLGGWNGPIPIAKMLGLTFDNGFAYGFFGNVLGTINLITKGIIGVTVMMWVRWTLPRLRIDQVITTCLKYCVPIAAVAFLIVTLWQYALPDRVFFGLMNLSSDSYQVREQLAPAESAAAAPQATPDKSARRDTVPTTDSHRVAQTN